MRFKKLDLNLLVAFDVLIEERSVSRAARRLNITQPAMSSALARLREFFKDDILVTHGKRMQPTAHAESLLPQVRDCLRVADTLIASSNTFDPATSQRVFRMLISDHVTISFLLPFIQHIAKKAPHISFDTFPPDQQGHVKLDSGEVDLLIAPSEYLQATHPVELLFEEDHVVVGWKQNEFFQGANTEKELFARPHVAITLGMTHISSFADRQLKRLQKPRNIEATTNSFTLVPWFLINTNRLAVIQRRLAAEFCKVFPLVYRPLPFAIDVMREMVQYHPSHAKDDGLKWLRNQFQLFAAGNSSINSSYRKRSK